MAPTPVADMRRALPSIVTTIALLLGALIAAACSSAPSQASTPTLAPLASPTSTVATASTTPGVASTIAPNPSRAAQSMLDSITVTPSDVCGDGRTRYGIAFRGTPSDQLRQVTAIVDGAQSSLVLPTDQRGFETADVPCDGRIRSVVVVVSSIDGTSVTKAFAVASLPPAP